jgi:hypothetical protein
VLKTGIILIWLSEWRTADDQVTNLMLPCQNLSSLDHICPLFSIYHSIEQLIFGQDEIPNFDTPTRAVVYSRKCTYADVAFGIGATH